MEHKEIVLYWEDIPLSTLSEVDGKYFYQVSFPNLKEALNRGCSESIMASSKPGFWNYLPPIFAEVEITPGREDIYELLGIKREDSRFEKLYKKALRSEMFNKNNFWISVK